MAIEPPLKKRKHYEKDAGSAELNPEPVVSALTEEQKLRRKMNRDEIGAFYKAYRRLKFCSGRKRSASPTSDPELGEAYCSILNLSTGTGIDSSSTSCFSREWTRIRSSGYVLRVK
jgi:hypothetical protein